MSRIARRVAWISFGVLAVQFFGALLVQAALSGMVRTEVIRQMSRGMEDSGALVNCGARPGPWSHSDGLWTVWPLTAAGAVVGDGAPLDRVVLPSAGVAASWSNGEERGIVFASGSIGCGGVLVVQHNAYPLMESRSQTLSGLVALRVALVLFAGIALVALTAAPLVRRIQRLSGAMRAVVAADFEGTVADESDDELGDVAAAFDAATATARARMQQLAYRDAVVRHALADFAHDARTPLATLKLATSGLPASASTTLFRSELDFLEGMTRNLEALLEGTESSVTERVGLDQLAARVEHRFAPLARDRGIVLETALPDEPLYVAAESIALERAVSNLLQNAVRFASSRIAVLVFADGAEVRLEVRDDGPGLGDLSRRASERGTRGPDANTEGAGLGLAIAESSARRFGGRLETGDADGGGALVAIVLPTATEQERSDLGSSRTVSR